MKSVCNQNINANNNKSMQLIFTEYELGSINNYLSFINAVILNR